MSEHHWPVYGHDWAVNHLRRSLLNGRVRHAYLITGTEAIGRETLARAFAMALNCTHEDPAARPCGECRACRLISAGGHPDLLYGAPDGPSGTLKIDEVRAITGRIALKPYEARYRIAVFRDFERAGPQAQDALLKTLEEPPPQAVLILIAQSPDALLPTITSRSQRINLRPVPADEVRTILIEQRGADPQLADLLARLSGGRVGWALRALADESILQQRASALDLLERIIHLNRAARFELAADLSKDKLALYPLLELWLTYWRDVLLACQGVGRELSNLDRVDTIRTLVDTLPAEEALAALTATRELLHNLSANINLRLALEVMFLDYPGLAR